MCFWDIGALNNLVLGGVICLLLNFDDFWLVTCVEFSVSIWTFIIYNECVFVLNLFISCYEIYIFFRLRSIRIKSINKELVWIILRIHYKNI